MSLSFFLTRFLLAGRYCSVNNLEFLTNLQLSIARDHIGMLRLSVLATPARDRMFCICARRSSWHAGSVRCSSSHVCLLDLVMPVHVPHAFARIWYLVHSSIPECLYALPRSLGLARSGRRSMPACMPACMTACILACITACMTACILAHSVDAGWSTYVILCILSQLTLWLLAARALPNRFSILVASYDIF